MEEKKYEIPFGKKMQFGNFTVMKFVKTLSGKQTKALREGLGMIPKSERSKLTRAGIPYIKIEAISGVWSMELCCNTDMYRQIEYMASQAMDEGDTPGTNTANLHHLCNMFFSDTAIRGDEEYFVDKAKALKSFMERCKAGEETSEEKATDDKILDEMQEDEKTKAAIVEMTQEAMKGGDE